MDDDEAPAQLKDRVAAGLKKARAAKKWTQQQMADATGLGQSKISQYENGVNLPPLHKLFAVDRACGQPAGYTLRLGSVIEAPDLVSMIVDDPRLTPEERTAFVSLYRSVTTGR